MSALEVEHDNPWDDVTSEHIAHKFDDDGIPDGFIAWVEYDQSSHDHSPRDWDNVSTFTTEDDDLTRAVRSYLSDGYDDKEWEAAGCPDEPPPDRWNGEADIFAEYYARKYLDAIAFDQFYTDRDTVYAYVTKADAEKHLLGDPPTSGPDAVEAWLAVDVEGRAKAALDQEIHTYNKWQNGEVYGVVVRRLSDGQEESIWDVYDDWDFAYCRTLANEYIEELTP